MFAEINLNQKTGETEFERAIDPLRIRLGELQRECREQGIPIIVVTEGWNASGITMVTGDLIRFLDPRGYSVHSIGRPTDEEEAHTLMWRFWIKTPARGRISLFARSWYSRMLAEKITGIRWKRELQNAIQSARVFERQLTDDGAVIIKFFLHISKEEQEKRLYERENDRRTSWMITRGDWDFHNLYDSYLPLIEDIIRKTDTPHSPWVIIGATDERYTRLSVFSSVVNTLERRIRMAGHPLTEKSPGGRKKLKKPEPYRYDLSVSLPHDEYQRRIDHCQERIRDLQFLLYKRKIPLIILFEGWDAAGKGGTIMRLTRSMNPRGYEVVPVSQPNECERDYHYLWRFYRHFPKSGHITIFDRSWYGRVLVERVEELCEAPVWQRAFQEITELEEDYIREGGGLVKFWLEIDQEEQLKRFTAREADPHKQWKMTVEDWRNREKWNVYREAIDEMLSRTGSRSAPWTVVESNDKYYSRIKTFRTVISCMEKLL
jgi:polyphosphate:AMP phosphotransferase